MFCYEYSGCYVMKISRPISSVGTQNVWTRNLILGKNTNDIKCFDFKDSFSQIVSLSSNPPQIQKFSQTQYDNVRVYIPAQAVDNYLDDENWAFFKNVIPLEKDIEDYQLSISTDSISLNVGEKTKFSYEITPVIDTDVYMYCTPDDYESQIIEISDGTVYAKKTGVGKITVISGLNGQIRTCEVSVIQPVTNIVLNKSAITINHGKTGKLFANLSPVDASDQSVIWSSSNSNVA